MKVVHWPFMDAFVMFGTVKRRLGEVLIRQVPSSLYPRVWNLLSHTVTDARNITAVQMHQF